MDFALIKRLTVSQRRAPRKRRPGRDARGMYIVEALVAMVISTILSFALLDMAMSAMRTMQRANSDGQAYEVIEELTEFTRAYGYERLVDYKDQTMTLVLNRSEGTQFENTSFHNRALLLDFVRRQWQSRTSSSKFEGTLTYYVFNGPEPDSLNVAIDLLWHDSASSERALGRVIVVQDVPSG